MLKISIVTITACVFFSLSAQEVDTTETEETFGKELIGLSLEELINMEVTIASKTPEKVSEAPSIVTSYSKSDIEH